MFNMKVVEPKRLDLETPFKFKCHKDIKCFTKCCSNIDIFLTPYDVLRIKNRLAIGSEQFLDEYTVMRVDPKSSHPYAYLKMGDDADRKCPFLVVPDGCTIYTDRPASCRYYPLGQATLKKDGGDGGAVHEEFYFFIREEHCLGYQEDTQWNVQSWRDDQGATHFDEMNRGWKELLMRKTLPGGKPIDQKKQTQFFMASYDLDRFRRFIFESKFLDTFDIDPAEVDKMRDDETALMKFAFKYIKYLMMLEETLKLKKGATAPQDFGK